MIGLTLPNLHPNGFRITILKAFANGMRLRFHYWPAGAKRLETPHDHRAWFVSLPLWGSFDERRFEQVPGSDRTVMRCMSTTGNGKPSTKKVGQGSVREIWRKIRRPLVPYYCGANEIHSIVPRTEGTAASIVLFGRPTKTPRAWLP